MKIATKLRILSLRNNLKGEVATLVLRNVDNLEPTTILRWMRDVVNNGCPYAYIKGLTEDSDIAQFYIRNKMDIDLNTFMDMTESKSPYNILKKNEATETFRAVERMMTDMMRQFGNSCELE